VRRDGEKEREERKIKIEVKSSRYTFTFPANNSRHIFRCTTESSTTRTWTLRPGLLLEWEEDVSVRKLREIGDKRDLSEKRVRGVCCDKKRQK
jgi:hypothetical protein